MATESFQQAAFVAAAQDEINCSLHCHLLRCMTHIQLLKEYSLNAYVPGVTRVWIPMLRSQTVSTPITKALFSSSRSIYLSSTSPSARCLIFLITTYNENKFISGTPNMKHQIFYHMFSLSDKVRRNYRVLYCIQQRST